MELAPVKRKNIAICHFKFHLPLYFRVNFLGGRLDAHSPLVKKKKATGSPQEAPRKEFRAFLIRLSLVSRDSTFLHSGSKSGLSPLGKVAAQAWTELSSQDSLGSQDGLRIDMVLFRPDEIEGILLISASPNMERKLGLAMRLLKARIAFAAVGPS